MLAQFQKETMVALPILQILDSFRVVTRAGG
jgi:hypothetical protein